MNKILYNALSFSAILLLTVVTSLAQQEQKKEQPKPESQYVDFSGFKGGIFELKHRTPEDLIPVLRALTSGFKGSTINGNNELKTITVRDFPENIATIEEAIKRLDAPLPPRAARSAPRDVDITVHILLASGNEADGNQYPQILKDVVTQLQATLNYKSFQLLTTIVQRTNLRNGVIISRGKAAVPGMDAYVNYRLLCDNIGSTPEDQNLIWLRRFNFEISGANDQVSNAFGSAEITTSLNVRTGEKIVVGTATLKDRAVILVLTAKM
ncbi:MAG: hypothetical protein IPM55_03835 [Acidobacteria bacterium]|nr:hypothetical protein [Acidobacteriota bacterium]